MGWREFFISHCAKWIQSYTEPTVLWWYHKHPKLYIRLIAKNPAAAAEGFSESLKRKTKHDYAIEKIVYLRDGSALITMSHHVACDCKDLYQILCDIVNQKLSQTEYNEIMKEVLEIERKFELI